MAEVEIFDFVQILFNPVEPISVNKKEKESERMIYHPCSTFSFAYCRRRRNCLDNLIAAGQVPPPERIKRTYVGGLCFFKCRVDAPLSPRFVIAVDTIASCRSGGCVEHWSRAEGTCRITCPIVHPLPFTGRSIHEQCWSPPTFRSLFGVCCHPDSPTV